MRKEEAIDRVCHGVRGGIGPKTMGIKKKVRRWRRWVILVFYVWCKTWKEKKKGGKKNKDNKKRETLFIEAKRKTEHSP